jgi:transposase
VVPEELKAALGPVLAVIRHLTDEIRVLDARIEEMAKQRYPETALLAQVSGVGTLTATVFVLTVEDWSCPGSVDSFVMLHCTVPGVAARRP